MVCGSVESGEIVVVVFYLGTLVYGKAHTRENGNKLSPDKRVGVVRALFGGVPGQGYVHLFGNVALLQFLVFNGPVELAELFLRPRFEGVDNHTHFGALVLGHVAHTLHKLAHFPALSKIFHFNLEQGVGGVHVLNRVGNLLF